MLALGGQGWDRSVLVSFYAGGDPALIAAARWLTEAGGAAVLIPAALGGGALILVLRRNWRTPLLFLATAFSGRLLVELQKDWLLRVRPDANEHLVLAQSYSFPSGHSANALMVWIGLALLSIALGCASYVLGQGSRWDWFDAPRIVGLTIGYSIDVAMPRRWVRVVR